MFCNWQDTMKIIAIFLVFMQTSVDSQIPYSSITFEGVKCHSCNHSRLKESIANINKKVWFS